MKVYIRQQNLPPGNPLLRLDLDDADVQHLSWSQLAALADIINTCTEAEANHEGDQSCTTKRRRFTVVSKRSQRFDA